MATTTHAAFAGIETLGFGDMVVSDPAAPSLDGCVGLRKVSYANGWVTLERVARNADGSWRVVSDKLLVQRAKRGAQVLIWRDALA